MNNKTDKTHECKGGCPVLARNVMDRVYCSKIPGQDVIAVYLSGSLIGKMEADPTTVGLPKITFFPDPYVPFELTFGDFDIMRKGWAAMGPKPA